ncbi:NADH-quinone oxidoreductase subunit L [Robiginitomaculum antarcticum]|uniref:NADH-quinone oxidoreductase subunit L n=1 Tax=Robiginitomaculum antarcticum TaxID=437507 RepID=UPI00038156F6
MYLTIVFGPLLGALIAGLFGRKIGESAAMSVTTAFLILSAVLSWVALIAIGFGHTATDIELMRWFDVGDLNAGWALKIDTLTAVMMVVITSVSSLVHVYSWGYMNEDDSKARFFAYLSLFTFAMLMLVTADNFIQLFFGWEGVGLASYLLIGFWYKKPSANAAAIKAFVTNRVGDVGLALGVMTIFLVFGSVKFDTVFSQVADKQDLVLPFLGMNFGAIELIAALLFIGAMGKSAQFFLHVWLPDAMEGPTPVSALIHAATMVTAGVFLVCRAYPIFEAAPITSGFITLIGALTAFFAATVGLVQNDIKRVIAYSTCSQLGYMFFAAGLGLYNAAMFHLFTHAFFKALLFLGAGSVIHALHHEQDMRKMGGTYKLIPLTYIFMIIGTLALTGVGIPGTKIGFAGFFSKDVIIEGAYAAANGGIYSPAMIAFTAGLLAALMTSFYSWRLIFLTFHGKYRGKSDVLNNAHESPPVMLIPLIMLGLGAIFAGLYFYKYFVGDYAAAFWAHSLPVDNAYSGTGLPPGMAESASHGADVSQSAEASYAEAGGDHNEDDGGHHEFPAWVIWSPFIAMLTGFIIAWFMYMFKDGAAKRTAASMRGEGGVLYKFLLNKWYFDELYDLIFVRPVRKLGDVFWKIGDQRIIDGLGPNGFAALASGAAKRVSKFQSGYLYHYALVMLVGLAAIIALVFSATGS